MDTGVDTGHPDLRLSGGFNVIKGEDPGDFGDNGDHRHPRGRHPRRPRQAPKGRLGIAPGVVATQLPRVRKERREESGRHQLRRREAIDRAVADGCDLINISLELLTDAENPAIPIR